MTLRWHPPNPTACVRGPVAPNPGPHRDRTAVYIGTGRNSARRQNVWAPARKWIFIGLLSSLLACNQAQRPLDAKERQRVDSIATADIFLIRKQIAEECQQAMEAELPKLVDSILSVRRAEIERALQGVPK